MKLTSAALCCSVWLAATVAAAEEQVVISDDEIQTVTPLNVAIVGAGAAGASSAYHLAQYANAANIAVNITVFERNDYIGGRSTVVYAYDDEDYPVELGASIFVEVNHILVDAVREFNLSTGSMVSGTEQIPGAELSVWDGKQFAFVQETGHTSWFDLARMLWRYGLAPVRTMHLMNATVSKFLRMYDEPVFPFASLTDAAEEVDLLSATGVTGEQWLQTNRIGGPFGHDVIQASTRVNYAQNLRYINGLLSMVCMATEGAMSVEGGNYRIFEQMIKASQASSVTSTAVTGLKKQEDGTYLLSYAPLTTRIATEDLHTAVFDAVILATPFQFSNITLHPDDIHRPVTIDYVQLHVTLFTSPHLLSPAFFNLPPGKAAPKTVLTTLQHNEYPQAGPAGAGDVGFFSISLLSPIVNPLTAGEEYLYKIFSPSELDATFLASLLGVDLDASSAISDDDITWIYRKVWHSYPYEVPRTKFDRIQLDDGVWYTAGMEGFISTMETNALAGKNVARLIVRQWEEEMLTPTSGIGDVDDELLPRLKILP